MIPTKRWGDSVRNYAKDWTLFERIWLISFTLINIYLFFAWKDSIIGLVTSLTGMLCVVLVAKGKISNYYFGVVNVVLYAYIAFQSRYFGEVMLNALYFLPMQFVGLYYWKKHSNAIKGKDDVVIKHLNVKQRIYWAVISVAGIFGYGLFLLYLRGTLPFVDSASTVLSVIAMILMVKRVTEQWLLWIAIDVVSVYMWFYILLKGGNDISMLVMWSAYLVNAIYGYYNWRKLENAQS
ncbi:nicotinamide mononucleotide transporter [Candidatus Woesearchaeota archaeon]|nr:nicotinamide mononucleotide transporter [Candidatus Woesearchaeota archaeon]